MGRRKMTMDRETQAAMRELGWTWSHGGQHFYKDSESTQYLVARWKSGWKAECYALDFTNRADWRSPIGFDTPFAAVAYAEVEGWKAQAQ